MPNTSIADIVLDWEKLTAALSNNFADLPGLEPLRQELETLLAEVRIIAPEQAARKAAAQQSRQELTDRLTRGRLLATRLRDGVRAHYGDRTEKIVEFGLRPYRKRARTPKTTEPELFKILEPTPGTAA